MIETAHLRLTRLKADNSSMESGGSCKVPSVDKELLAIDSFRKRRMEVFFKGVAPHC